jgi:hypothetical protein
MKIWDTQVFICGQYRISLDPLGNLDAGATFFPFQKKDLLNIGIRYEIPISGWQLKTE